MIKFNLKTVFQIDFLLLFSAMLISNLLDQYLNRQIEEVIKSPQGLSNVIWFWGAVSLISSMVFPLIIALLCSHALVRLSTPVTDFFSEKFELGLVETFRAWGKTFLWSFLFIIPGLVKFSYYMLTPFVVFFSKKYARGEVDALAYSEKMAKKFWWQLNAWMTLFYVIIPISLSSAIDEARLFKTHPITALLCVLLETFLILIFHFLILKLFLKKLNEVDDGSYV